MLRITPLTLLLISLSLLNVLLDGTLVVVKVVAISLTVAVAQEGGPKERLVQSVRAFVVLVSYDEMVA